MSGNVLSLRRMVRIARAAVLQIIDDRRFGTLPSGIRQRLRRVWADLDGIVAELDEVRP